MQRLLLKIYLFPPFFSPSCPPFFPLLFPPSCPPSFPPSLLPSLLPSCTCTHPSATGARNVSARYGYFPSKNVDSRLKNVGVGVLKIQSQNIQSQKSKVKTSIAHNVLSGKISNVKMSKGSKRQKLKKTSKVTKCLKYISK